MISSYWCINNPTIYKLKNFPYAQLNFFPVCIHITHMLLNLEKNLLNVHFILTQTLHYKLLCDVWTLILSTRKKNFWWKKNYNWLMELPLRIPNIFSRWCQFLWFPHLRRLTLFGAHTFHRNWHQNEIHNNYAHVQLFCNQGRQLF